MLKKLLKYELTFMSKFLMIYGIITLSLAILTRIFFAIDSTMFLRIVAEIFQGAFLSFAISTLINVLMKYWVRFRANFYGDESYLTHTLPVEKRTLYASKVLGGVITMLATVAFLIGCVFVAYATPANFEWIKNSLSAIETAMNASVGGFIALVCVLLVIQCLMFINIGFLGLVVGHRFGHSRVGLSVLFGAISYVAAQMFLVIVVVVMGCFDASIMQLLTTMEPASLGTLTTLIVVAIVCDIVAIAVISFVGCKIFEKGVNVD